MIIVVYLIVGILLSIPIAFLWYWSNKRENRKREELRRELGIYDDEEEEN